MLIESGVGSYQVAEISETILKLCELLDGELQPAELELEADGGEDEEEAAKTMQYDVSPYWLINPPPCLDPTILDGPIIGDPAPTMGGPAPMIAGPAPMIMVMMGGPVPIFGGPVPMIGGPMPAPVMGGPTAPVAAVPAPLGPAPVVVVPVPMVPPAFNPDDYDFEFDDYGLDINLD